MALRGSDDTNIKIKEDMDPGVCKKLDGDVLELKSGRSACVFARDEDGEPVDIDLDNVTPEVKEEIKQKTGEPLK